MNLGDLIRQAAEAEFITGIYNYCDRWCERCPLTARCLLFHQEQAPQSVAAGPDTENQKFWEQLSESLHDAANILTNTADRWDVDLAERDAADLVGCEEELTQRLAEEPLPRLAEDYAKQVDEWFLAAAHDFEAKGDELRSIEEMQLTDSDPATEAEDIADCVEIVRWYQFQIRSKLMRAYSGAARALSSNTSSDEEPGDLVDELADRSIPLTEIEARERELYDAIDDLEWDDDDSSDDGGVYPEALGESVTERVNQTEEAASDEDPFADFEDEEDPEFEAALRAEELADANGSAKVALIGMDRSIAAWTRLRPHLPDRADELLDVLVMLDRLRRATEAQFPDARSFYRPGFDD